MRTVTLTCDRCEKVVDEKGQLWSVEIRFSCYPTNLTHNSPEKKAEWCRPCMEEFHLLERKKDEPPVTAPKPTLENILREIIGEEVGEAMANQ